MAFFEYRRIGRTTGIGSLFALTMIAATTSGTIALAEEGDIAAGEKVFKKCSACHKVGDDAKNRVGPVLNGVFGRTAGTFEGFKYGKDLAKAGEMGLVWDDELVFTYIENPKQFLRDYLGDKKAKTKMTFRLKKEEDRRNVVAYLKTFSPDAESEGETTN